MRKELTIVVIFLLGLLADTIWLINSVRFGKLIYVQIIAGLILLSFILLVGKKYLVKHLGLRRKFSTVSVWKFVRSGFQPRN